MKKRVIQLSFFVLCVAMGLMLVAASGGGSQNSCSCFDELQAEQTCESLCQYYTGERCRFVMPIPVYGYCVADSVCTMPFWSYCLNGESYRRWQNQDCVVPCEQMP